MAHVRRGLTQPKGAELLAVVQPGTGRGHLAAASQGSHVQEVLERREDVSRLACGHGLQPGAHLLLEAPGQPAQHRADVPAVPGQDAVPHHVVQEVPEDRKDMALHGLGLSGVNRGHQHCRAEQMKSYVSQALSPSPTASLGTPTLSQQGTVPRAHDTLGAQ